MNNNAHKITSSHLQDNEVVQKLKKVPMSEWQLPDSLKNWRFTFINRLHRPVDSTISVYSKLSYINML